MAKNNPVFTKSMRKTHTIYMPDMLHYHNDLLCAAFKYGGYNLSIVPETDKVPGELLSLINSGYCTCAMDIIGNLMAFIKSGKIDVERTAVLEPQAGGACRAGNYYNLIIMCLHRLGYNIPVLSLNFSGLESHPGFKINLKMFLGAVAAVCYGDLLQTLYQQTLCYEKNTGETNALYDKWIKKLASDIEEGKNLLFRKKIYEAIVSEFLSIERFSKDEKPLKKVGIVGEIYVKCSHTGNRHLEDFLHENGMEFRSEGFINYCIYVLFTELKSTKLNRGSFIYSLALKALIKHFIKMHSVIRKSLAGGGYLPDGNFYDMKEKAAKLLSEYYNIGDGWLVVAEAMDMLEQGYDKILIVHPFGCLVSHVAERGVIKKLREMYPNANINSIEYDYDQSKTLRESRILLATN
ncbi:MAG: hypothetical protein J6033_04620 [Lachnospiraceae bacterium]|nr:hypothetical protein [Lachnospiraceae bacterium]